MEIFMKANKKFVKSLLFVSLFIGGLQVAETIEPASATKYTCPAWPKDGFPVKPNSQYWDYTANLVAEGGTLGPALEFIHQSGGKTLYKKSEFGGITGPFLSADPSYINGRYGIICYYQGADPEAGGRAGLALTGKKCTLLNTKDGTNNCVNKDPSQCVYECN
jgi:hypothetical protein